jgi:hypothetical protein
MARRDQQGYAMNGIRATVTLALMALSISSSAQEFTAEDFQDPSFGTKPPSMEALQDVSRDMLKTYRIEGVAGMRRLESQCWDEAEKDSFRLVSLCAAILRAGTVIETHYARNEGREPNPVYGQAAPARLVAYTTARLSGEKLEQFVIWNDDPETQQEIVDSLYTVGMH